jgi:hypothetical protein
LKQDIKASCWIIISSPWFDDIKSLPWKSILIYSATKPIWCICFTFKSNVLHVRFPQIPSNAQHYLFCNCTTCFVPKTIFRYLQLDSYMLYAWLAMLIYSYICGELRPLRGDQIRFPQMPTNAKHFLLCHWTTCFGPETIFSCLQLDSCMLHTWLAMLIYTCGVLVNIQSYCFPSLLSTVSFALQITFFVVFHFCFSFDFIHFFIYAVFNLFLAT